MDTSVTFSMASRVGVRLVRLLYDGIPTCGLHSRTPYAAAVHTRAPARALHFVKSSGFSRDASVDVHCFSTSSGQDPREDARGDCAPDEVCCIDTAAARTEGRMIEVCWSAGGNSTYPWLWLRDNCQCQLCFHSASLCRTFFLKDLDLNIQPIKVQVTQSKRQLKVRWSDGHETQHGALWLRQRAFEERPRAQRLLTHRLPRKPWPPTLPSVEWQGVMEDDSALLRWLVLLETYGVVLVTGAPQQPGYTRRLAERVAFVKRTHYGEDFSVINKPEPSNVAYSSGPLALHLDLPYYLYKPGVQLIYWIEQHDGAGGESLVCDAMQVAEYLRQANPHEFDLLAHIPVDWCDQATEDGKEYFKVLRMPLICLQEDCSTISRINYSQPQRDSYFTDCPLETVNEWYGALKTFHDLLHDPRFCRTFKMTPGSLITLDNLRITHGRTGYPSAGSRHVEGCYLDWDEVWCRRRVLQRRLGTAGSLTE